MCWNSIAIYIFPCMIAYIAFVVDGLLCCFHREFTDRDFPPSAKSIGDWKGKSEAEIDAEIEWRRASEFFTSKLTEEQRERGVRVKLFEDGIKPGDVAQGKLGNCWLIAALACVSEHPAIIRKVFLTERASANGKYKVRLFDARNRKWVVVTVDEHIPIVRKGQDHLFADPSGNELWAIILEKAFAKMVGSYAELRNGHPLWAFHAITGDPVYVLTRRESDNSWRRKDVKFDDESMRTLSWWWSNERHMANDAFFLLRTLSHTDSLIGAACSNKGESKQSNGLVKGHAYSVLDARSFNDERKAGLRINLIQLRNPWGMHEWTGAWSDHAKEWDTYPQIKRILNPVGANDGSFWMQYADFLGFFDHIDVCQRSNGLRDLNIKLHEADGCLPNCVGPWLGCCQGCGLYWCARAPPLLRALRSRARPWLRSETLRPARLSHPLTLLLPPIYGRAVCPPYVTLPGLHPSPRCSGRCCCKGYKAIYHDYKASSVTMEIEPGRDDDALAVVAARMNRSSTAV
jgi:hypothetical protein